MAVTWSRTFEWDAEDWRKEAACRDTPAELFFPIGTTGGAVSEIEAAKAVCQVCPAREPCLEFALETNQESGIWGGASEEERRQLRRRRAGAGVLVS